MKIQILLLLMMAIVAAVPVSVLAMTGGDYEISWSTIDGGGGRSTGGDYALVGTIGQPDAGDMAGGDYELSGGFCPADRRWPFVLLTSSTSPSFG